MGIGRHDIYGPPYRRPVQLEVRTIDPNDGTFGHEPGANTDAVVVLTSPGAGYRWALERVVGFYNGGAPAQTIIRVESPPGTTIFRYPSPDTQGVAADIAGPIFGAPGEGVRVILPAGGVGITGRVYVSAVRTKEVVV